MSSERNRLALAALAAALAVSCLSACTASTPTMSNWQQADASRPAVPTRQSEALSIAPSKGSARVGYSSRRGTALTMKTKTNLQLSGRATATRAEARSQEVTPPPVHQLSPTTPNIGSVEWKAEQQEDERREQHIKKVIQGICQGC